MMIVIRRAKRLLKIAVKGLVLCGILTLLAVYKVEIKIVEDNYNNNAKYSASNVHKNVIINS